MLLVTNGRLITRDAAQPYFEDAQWRLTAPPSPQWARPPH